MLLKQSGQNTTGVFYKLLQQRFKIPPVDIVDIFQNAPLQKVI